MSKQAIRTIGQANNYAAPTIERYAKRNWFRVVTGFGALALIAGLSGCPSREQVKKLPAQIVDGGRMGEGAQAVVKPPEKKDAGRGDAAQIDLSTTKPRRVEIEVKGRKIILDIGDTDGIGGLGLRSPAPIERKKPVPID